jgi:glycosyltransferase involved in cell wall biosynthesis
MKKIAIIIPAYNEENNISNILKDIFKQKEKNFVIHQIIVLNDGSTDKTVQKVNSIKDKRIRLISGTDRKGKTFRMNEVFKILKEDILVQFDADISPNLSMNSISISSWP